MYMYVHTPHLTSPQAEAALSSATTSSAGGTAATTGATGSTSGGHQPVEFNHAINYVNKIKVHCSFCRQTFNQFIWEVCNNSTNKLEGQRRIYVATQKKKLYVHVHVYELRRNIQMSYI